MPRIRTVKPDFWTDSKIVGLSPLARLLFIGSWNFADDFGGLEADPIQLKLRVLPAEPCDPAELVDELLAAGLLVEMTNGTDRFWHIAGWEKHQKVDKRSTSQFGDPSHWTPVDTDSHQPPPSPAEPRRTPPSPRPGREGKGEERKGEGTRETSSRRTPPHPLPDDWQPNDTHAEIATTEGVDLAREAAKFRDHAAANDRRQPDWDATFRKWLRNDFAASRARASPEPRRAREPVVGSPEWEARQQEQQARAAALAGQEEP